MPPCFVTLPKNQKHRARVTRVPIMTGNSCNFKRTKSRANWRKYAGVTRGFFDKRSTGTSILARPSRRFSTAVTLLLAGRVDRTTIDRRRRNFNYARGIRGAIVLQLRRSKHEKGTNDGSSDDGWLAMPENVCRLSLKFPPSRHNKRERERERERERRLGAVLVTRVKARDLENTTLGCAAA